VGGVEDLLGGDGWRDHVMIPVYVYPEHAHISGAVIDWVEGVRVDEVIDI
jgi:hypothetical protein